MNIFEKASRLKLTFASTRGTLNVEDLWDLPLTQLDALYVGYNKKLKETQEESLLAANKSDPELKLRVEIIKHVFEVKVAENEAKKMAKDKLAKKARIMEIIERKQDESLSEKSIEDLRKELDELSV